MVAFGRSEFTLDDMRRITMLLERAAGEADDEFLQHLYGMALLHLEEWAHAEQKGQRGSRSREVDPVVEELAAKLLASTDPKAR